MLQDEQINKIVTLCHGWESGQIRLGCLVEWCPSTDTGYCFINKHEHVLPTLETLIKACGEEFVRLERGIVDSYTTLGWIALGEQKKNGRFVVCEGKGNTPEIAVFELWKVLNARAKVNQDNIEEFLTPFLNEDTEGEDMHNDNFCICYGGECANITWEMRRFIKIEAIHAELEKIKLGNVFKQWLEMKGVDLFKKFDEQKEDRSNNTKL